MGFSPLLACNIFPFFCRPSTSPVRFILSLGPKD
jgi:hypothetical protein